jgi:hypothetical protein
VDELEKEFSKRQYSFTSMMVELDRNIQCLQLGDKFIEMDNWQEERFTEVTAQLYLDLEMKEEALKEIEADVQEIIVKASAITEASMVN